VELLGDDHGYFTFFPCVVYLPFYMFSSGVFAALTLVLVLALALALAAGQEADNLSLAWQHLTFAFAFTFGVFWLFFNRTCRQLPFIAVGQREATDCKLSWKAVFKRYSRWPNLMRPQAVCGENF
jgi:peptidoglycan/LPS O-acetylase OafA/YrhL